MSLPRGGGGGNSSSSASGAGAFKRKRYELAGDLTKDETEIFELIQSKRDVGIWKGDVKRELKHIQGKTLDATIKKLLTIGKIKEVANVQNKGKPRLMDANIEPSTEVTGGEWYDNEGKLDEALIQTLTNACLQLIRRSSVMTASGIHGLLTSKNIVEVSVEQINELLNSMLLDNQITKHKSTGCGEFAGIPNGEFCYKFNTKTVDRGPRTGAMALMPCGACPRINQCTPDGVISPVTCPYFTKWLDF